jgi:hypothetical protein
MLELYGGGLALIALSALRRRFCGQPTGGDGEGGRREKKREEKNKSNNGKLEHIVDLPMNVLTNDSICIGETTQKEHGCCLFNEPNLRIMLCVRGYERQNIFTIPISFFSH